METFIILSRYIPIELCEIIYNYIGIINIKHTIEQSGINFIEFCTNLKTNKAIIAGSFPLMSVLNDDTRNEHNDVDIFIPYSETHTKKDIIASPLEDWLYDITKDERSGINQYNYAKSII